MYLAYTVTHAPEQAPAEYVDRYPADWVTGRRLYAGMASALDDSVGNITRTLKEVGMWPNTLVIFSSDKCVGATVVYYFICFAVTPAPCMPERRILAASFTAVGHRWSAALPTRIITR